jgi:uncharacterized membrane protein
MELERILGAVGSAFEVAGVAVMVIGAVASVGLLFFRRPKGHGEAYRRVRRQLGASILLGLELLIASDIIFTVTGPASLHDVAVLGLIVMLRTFLSYTLEVELEGTWPWRRAGASR